VKLALVCVLFFVASCRRGGGPSSSDATAPQTSASVAAASASAERPGSTKPPSPRLSDPRWILAKDEDPLERARLAEALGASELVDALDDGGEIRTTALGALPYADDADLALGPLAALAEKAPPGELGPLVEAMLAIAGKPRRPRELLDPEGARKAGSVLLSLAARSELEGELRALAISAARALAEKGYVDPARIPSDRDPAP